jgi:hypothetical protein
MRVVRVLMAALLLFSLLGGAALAKTKFYGTVEQMPPYGPYGIWIIGGRAVLVTAETKMKSKRGPIVPGAWVEVEGKYYGGQFVASEIETKGPK